MINIQPVHKKRIFLSFVLGLVMCVGMLVYCSCFVNVYAVRMQNAVLAANEIIWEIAIWEKLGAIRVESVRIYSSRGVSIGLHPDEMLPWWSSLREPTHLFLNDPKSVESRWEEGRGWPFVVATAGGEIRWSDRTPLHVEYGFQYSKRRWDGTEEYQSTRVFPLRLIWAGLIMNVLCYSAFSYFLITLFIYYQRFRHEAD